MNTFDSSAFGKIAAPQSFEELLDIACTAPEDRGRVRMWRGHGNAAWPLHSAAFRRLAQNNHAVTERDMRHYERSLLTQATHRGFRDTGSRLLSDLELLARLQHHGAATRLIDTSRNMLVALWFTVSDDRETTGALIGIHSDFLGGYEGEPETSDYADLMDRISERDHPFTWEPTAVSPRVAAQHSQFVLSKIVDRPSGSLCLDSDRDAAVVFAISPELKRTSRELLVETFDIRTATLFPDLDGFGRANAHTVPRWDMYRW